VQLQNSCDSIYPSNRAANLWPACSKRHAAFTAVRIFYIYLALPTSLYCKEYVYISLNISDSVETVYELPLLAKNITSETFLHKSEAVWSVDWIFNIGAPTWRWLGEYVTLDKAFYNLLFRQEAVAAPFTATVSSLPHSSMIPLWEM